MPRPLAVRLASAMLAAFLLVFLVSQSPVPILDTIKSGSPTSSCIVGQRYFQSNAIAGNNTWYCTTTDHWTQILNSGGASHGLVLLEQQTATSSASLNFTACLSSAYDVYMISHQNIIPDTDGVKIGFRYSEDGGSSYITTATYTWSTYATSFSGGGGPHEHGQQNDTAAYFDPHQSSTVLYGGLVGNVYLYGANNTTTYKIIQGTGFGIENAGGIYSWQTFGYRQSANAVNAFQIIPSTGLLASGTVRCYGLRKV